MSKLDHFSRRTAGKVLIPFAVAAVLAGGSAAQAAVSSPTPVDAPDTAVADAVTDTITLDVTPDSVTDTITVDVTPEASPSIDLVPDADADPDPVPSVDSTSGAADPVNDTDLSSDSATVQDDVDPVGAYTEAADTEATELSDNTDNDRSADTDRS